MMDRLDREILYNTAWKHWGADMQIDILIEEMAELTQALLKTRRNGVVFSHAVFEEIADVQICLEQLDIQFEYLESYKQIEQIKEAKLLRLKERLMESMVGKHCGDD